MFESCLRNYPARMDVWSQYLDQVGCASTYGMTRHASLVVNAALLVPAFSWQDVLCLLACAMEPFLGCGKLLLPVRVSVCKAAMAAELFLLPYARLT